VRDLICRENIKNTAANPMMIDSERTMFMTIETPLVDDMDAGVDLNDTYMTPIKNNPTNTPVKREE